jgi:chromate transport protein ChrA
MIVALVLSLLTKLVQKKSVLQVVDTMVVVIVITVVVVIVGNSPKKQHPKTLCLGGEFFYYGVKGEIFAKGSVRL